MASLYKFFQNFSAYRRKNYPSKTCYGCQCRTQGGQMAIDPFCRGEKIENFVAFTQNLRSKSLKIHHFPKETFFLGFENNFFKILPLLYSGFYV